jgi:hypothetical protein
MDFTIKKYKELLQALKKNNYSFQTFEDFLIQPNEKTIVLRHDVDLLPKNSLRFAKIQKSFGIKGTYFFRAVPESWDNKIIVEIASLGHEIGYHYENLTTCKGNFLEAIKDFETNLINLRKLSPVSTACMHGSPMSKYDSKDLWTEYNYKDFDIKGTPYFDVDFDKVFYLTDTGRRWDGHNVSVRDKVETVFTQSFHTTDQIIHALSNEKLPNQIMITFHPQRWHSTWTLWFKELIIQNIKNSIKKYFFVK